MSFTGILRLLTSGLLVSLPLVTVAADEPPAAAEAAAPADAAAPDPEAVHNELRALRDSILKAWEKRDIDGMLVQADPEVIVTWQNGEVSRGPAAIKKFYQDLFEANGGIIADMKTTLEVDALATLYGADTAIASGSAHDVISFRKSLTTSVIGAGDTLELDSRWTATAVRRNGEWKLASYHVSANVFSNPVMALAVKSTRRIAIAGGVVAGVAIMLIVMWLRRKRASPA
jgi:ketosteroid isomerase-like protein